MADVIDVFEVDLMFWSLWFMFPIVVAAISPNYLLIAYSVRPDQAKRCPFLTACNNEYFVELNRALCKQCPNAPVLCNP
jgi:hypothetical protein